MTRLAQIGTPEETRQVLAQVPRASLQAFLRTFGAKPGRDAAGDIRAVAEIVHARERVAAHVETLPADHRELFFLLATRTRNESAADLERRAWESKGIPKDRVRSAVAALTDAGLAVPTGNSGGVALLAGVRAWCGDAMVAWIAGARPDAPEPLPIPFLLALLASLVAEDPPALTVRGDPRVRWTTKACLRMLHPACPPGITSTLLLAGARLGLWAHESGPLGVRLRVAPEGVRRAFALPHRDFLLALVNLGLGAAEEISHGLATVERAFRRSGADTTDFATLIQESTALGVLTRTSSAVAYGFAPWGGTDALGLARGVCAAARLGFVSVDRGPLLGHVRRVTPEPTEGRWTVLPNYKVLVPSDTPPTDVFRLACVARLERVDRVAEFVLDRASVGRCQTVEGLGAGALEILTSRTAHPIPDAVAAAVTEWDHAAPEIRAFVGSVIVAATEEQSAALRADAERPAEIAPGVFHVTAFRLRPLLDRMRKRGLAVGRVSEPAHFDPFGRPAGATVVPDLAAAARMFRRRLDDVVAMEPPKPREEAAAAVPKQATTSATRSATKPVPASAPASAAPTPAGSAASAAEARDRLAEILAIGEPGLKRRYPRVHDAVAGDPDLLRLAARLTADHLREVARFKQPKLIQEAVRVASDEWERMLANAVADGVPRGENEVLADEGEDDDQDDTPGRAGPRSRAASWQSPPPGELRRRLEAIIESDGAVDVLYVNTLGEQRARTIRPQQFRTAGRFDWIDAIEPALGNARVSLRLDRISALRA